MTRHRADGGEEEEASSVGGGNESGWLYLGSNSIVKPHNIQITQEVFEVGVFDRRYTGDEPPTGYIQDAETPDDLEDVDFYAYWSYEQNTGTMLISDAQLTRNSKPNQASYVTLGCTKVGGQQNIHRVRIPNDFISPADDADLSRQQLLSKVSEDARKSVGERLHFVTRERYIKETPKSCYLLTDDEMVNTFRDADDMDFLGTRPRFI
jgi:hypothetical protein